MSAYLIVRAVVPDADHDKFDHWYETEHLSDAFRDFRALSAKRGWSSIDPTVHWAMYEFPDVETANAIATSDVIKELVAEFDRVWEDRVKRTREVVGIVQAL